MNLALDRDQLVEKRLVDRQLTNLLISIRQKLLTTPAKLYSRLAKNDSRVRLRKSARSSFTKS
jgi:hypothetical protein